MTGLVAMTAAGAADAVAAASMPPTKGAAGAPRAEASATRE